ncbi:uncharacterized protein LOC108101265 [Drosophila ficusphila]|uniref:uncharacterized protein LOC108101265 n=1 Tax=Drosophila ficusphila TaxID=30025 RepID=UPI0007E846F1|nr:uncharacterized protein LOC108101265 [Drosophila ficusphila]
MCSITLIAKYSWAWISVAPTSNLLSKQIKLVARSAGPFDLVLAKRSAAFGGEDRFQVLVSAIQTGQVRPPDRDMEISSRLPVDLDTCCPSDGFNQVHSNSNCDSESINRWACSGHLHSWSDYLVPRLALFLD